MELKYLLFLVSALLGATTVTFLPVPGEGPAVPVLVTITDIVGGVRIQTNVTGNPIGDLRGLFFDLSGSNPTCGQISGWTSCQVNEAAVVNLGQGANLQGLGHLFDVGLEIGGPGIGGDDIQSIINVIAGSIMASQFTAFGVRVTSVSNEDGREGSSKLIDLTPDSVPDRPTPEPGTLLLIGIGLSMLGRTRRFLR